MKSQNILDFEDSLTFEQAGLYLGYPKCCVLELKEYFKAMNDGKLTIVTNVIHTKLYGTGYIPCRECNKKSEQELLETIKANRVCKVPFPEFNFPIVIKNIKKKVKRSS